MAVFKPKEMADRLGVTVRTLQNWDRKGIFPAHRTPTNKRYYTEQDYLKYINDHSDPKLKDKGKIVGYARVSTVNQKDDLKDQEKFIREFVNAKGIILDEMITEIGSGLNYQRKKWNKLLDEVMQGKIETIYITYQDRFIRFGYDWFEKLCNQNGTKIVVLNNQETSPNKELVQDVLSILHAFSCRLYGLRKYKHKISEDKELTKK
ncbi:MAG: IS607 family transposase [Lactobacillus iners]|nr:IS607 family transposase [Lactobacillus iners]MCT7842516.1 IS607 family transposase [Lactobacillus iners]